MSGFGKTTGYILDAPGRPTVSEQERVLSIHGVTPGDTWRDAAGVNIKNGQKALTARSEMIESVTPGSLVVFARPICLGISPDDAGWLLDEISRRGGTVRIDGGTLEVGPGGDRSGVISAIRRRQKAIYQGAWRARQAADPTD